LRQWIVGFRRGDARKRFRCRRRPILDGLAAAIAGASSMICTFSSAGVS
jgi:hypothetical protein